MSSLGQPVVRKSNNDWEKESSLCLREALLYSPKRVGLGRTKRIHTLVNTLAPAPFFLTSCTSQTYRGKVQLRWFCGIPLIPVCHPSLLISSRGQRGMAGWPVRSGRSGFSVFDCRLMFLSRGRTSGELVAPVSSFQFLSRGRLSISRIQSKILNTSFG